MMLEDSNGIPYHVQKIRFTHRSFLITATCCNGVSLQFRPDSLCQQMLRLQGALTPDQAQDAFTNANKFVEENLFIVYPKRQGPGSSRGGKEDKEDKTKWTRKQPKK